MKKWLITLCILILPMLFYYIATDIAGKDTTSEIQAAYAQSKPCLYKFSSTMCLDCQEQEKIIKIVKPVYEDKINFIDYKVDKSDKKVQGLIKKYGITLVPTIILVDANGNDKLKIEGLVSQEELEKHLKALINE